MAERGPIALTLNRGATVAEFGRFLSDLEAAYLAIYTLPSWERGWPARRIGMAYPDADDLLALSSWMSIEGSAVYPEDQLEITRISIQSPGWVEFVGSLNPLIQIREYLKDRHERKKDAEWRSEAEKDRARLELEVLRVQLEVDRLGAIQKYANLLDHAGLSPDQRDRLIWERIGGPLSRLGLHQDSGLLGDQAENGA